MKFLRKGPRGGALDMNAMLQGALDTGIVNNEKIVEEVNALVKWQAARKKWHHDKTRQKMAKSGESESRNLGAFGFNEVFSIQEFYLCLSIADSSVYRTIFKTLNSITRTTLPRKN